MFDLESHMIEALEQGNNKEYERIQKEYVKTNSPCHLILANGERVNVKEFKSISNNSISIKVSGEEVERTILEEDI